MLLQHDEYGDVIPYDSAGYYGDVEEWLEYQAGEEYAYYCGLITDLEDLDDDSQVEYLSECGLSEYQCRMLDMVRDAHRDTEVQA